MGTYFPPRKKLEDQTAIFLALFRDMVAIYFFVLSCDVILHLWPCLLPQHIVDSMKDPSIAAFWLFSLPQIMGGFDYDDEVKQKIWWQYKVNFILLSISVL